jgi:osmotically-inducible protein OsmY
MEDTDIQLEQSIRDIIAVAADDLDSVTFDVEDGVAYLEGVVPDEQRREALLKAVNRLPGVDRVIPCLATEHVLPMLTDDSKFSPLPTPVLMHFYSLS